MKRTPLRQLILIPIVLTVTVGLVALSVFIHESMESELIEQVDAELIRAQQETATRVRIPAVNTATTGNPIIPANPDQPAPPPGDQPRPVDGEPGPPGQDLAIPIDLVLSSDGQLVEQISALSPFDADDLVAISRIDGVATLDTGHRVRTLREADGTIIVTALSLSSVDTTLGNLRRTLLLGSLVVLVAQGLLIWLLASYLTRPLTAMTQSARQIASGQLDVAIGEPSGARETADLAVDLDRMVEQLRSTVETTAVSAEEARAARQNMQRFLADASHELRTPLTALRGYAELYNADMLAEPHDLDRAMRRIGSESVRMTRLVTDMLQLARTNAFAESTMAELDLNALVEGLASDLSAAQPENPPSYSGTEGPLCITGDADHIHQALLSIAANAYHHTASDTAVGITLSTDETYATISIADNGPGIDSVIAEKIFEPFFQADQSRAADGGARAGLGLAIAKRIVDAHAGTIRVEQTEGGGATFVISFPTDGRLVS